MEALGLTMFDNLYTGRRVLITGHTGFKGSWLALWLRTLGAEVSGLALDPDTTPSHWLLLGLNDIADHRVNLGDTTAVNAVLQAHQPEIVFHLAAQPLVRRSYQAPANTFASNVMGLVNLLESVRDCPSVRVLINVTTDKVYAEQEGASGYCENNRLGGHDPYSSSKACAELVSDCYRKSFFDNSTTRIATARAGNVIGGGDWAEDRLVPDLIRAANHGQTLAIRNPSAIRPWQHVLEPLSGYLRLGQRLWDDASLAGAWNFGPGSGGEVSVSTLTAQLARHWSALQVRHDDSPQPHEATLLRLDVGKAQRELAWHPVWDINTSLARTANWYHDYHDTGYVASRDDLQAYVRDAQHCGREWTR